MGKVKESEIKRRDDLRKFNKLLRQARMGNVDAITDLIDITETNATQTNRKMRALEKAEYDFYSYDRPKAALEILNRQRFREKWSVDKVVNNWKEFEETARETYIFNNMRSDRNTPAKIRNYSQKRLSYLLDLLEKSDTRGMDEQTVTRLFEAISNLREEGSSGSEQVKQMERAIASGAISNLFSQQYGITGEAFEALYTAFENGAEFTQEVAERIQDLTRGLQKINGNTTEDLLEYIRSLGE